MFNNFFSNNLAVYEMMMEKYCRAGHATDDNMAHALCMLDILGYKHTHSKCSTYCFSNVKIVGRTRLTVTLYRGIHKSVKHVRKLGDTTVE